MRKTVLTILIALILRTAFLYGEPFFCPLVLKTSGTLGISDERKSTFTGAAGIVLDSSLANLRSFIKIPKSELNSLSSAFKKKDFSSIFDSPHYGAGIFLLKDTIPVTIKAGNISYSRAVSRLKNPVPSLPSTPLSKGFYFSSGISSSLPTLASTEERLSLFCEADLSKQNIPITMQTAYIDDKTVLSSLGIKIKFTRYTRFQTYLSGGRFYLENKSSYLSKNSCSFDGEWRYAISWESSFISPFLKVNMLAGIHQSPWNNNSIWISSKLRTGAGPFLVDLGWFAIPTEKDSPLAAPLISANSSVIKTVEQAYVNPQLIMLAHPNLSLRLGITASETWKITGSSSVASINVGKASFGILAETKSSSLKTVLTAANILLSGTPPSKAYKPDRYYALSASSTHNTRIVRGTLSMAARHYPPENADDKLKQTISVNAKAGFGKIRSLSLSAGFDTVLKDREKDSAKCSLAASWKIKRKHILSTAKIALDMDL